MFPRFIQSRSCRFLALTSFLASAGALSAQDTPAPEPQPEAPAPAASIPSLPGLKIADGHFRDASGEIVRFWGVNLVSLYPTHRQAENIAATLAGMQVNLARPHHLLRRSKDWNPRMVSGAIALYGKNSVDLDPAALERFDYLNAELQKKGIYLAMSAHFTRTIIAGDVDILETTPEDRDAWVKAVDELNGWDWKKGFDLKKLLPVVDERSALVMEESNRRLFSHRNPYTGRTYAEDPQVLSIEVLNESSLEYAIICTNRFPDYFQAKLEARWKAFRESQGAAPCDLYKMPDATAKQHRARFLRQLDEDFFLRMKKFLASLGCQAPVTYSNLWRGDNVNQMHYEHAAWMENHAYVDPRLADSRNDGVYEVSRGALAGKPFFIGELNQAEGEEKIKEQKPYRTMLQAGMVAYGLLQDWDGLEWFSWVHGDQHLDADGNSREAGRDASLGEMMSDRMMQDHLRALGHVFRRELIKPSVQPVTVWVDRPFNGGDYHSLMRGKTNYKPGWQGVHAIRKAYGPVPEGQATAPWMTQDVAQPIISDTGEIVKDTKRKQLTVTAPQVEIISGALDGAAPQGPKYLRQDGAGLWGTLVLVALDDKPLAESRHLLVSRTLLDKDLREISEPAPRLQGITVPADQGWKAQITRNLAGVVTPGGAEQALATLEDGSHALPPGDWTECELRRP
jgi:hypothetical protein